ncbi:hypothetical protein [Flavivirga eckloniae]|uniref:Nicotinate-nucleotide adenylyltransferase n=1 Tax=Flavivirga eckloniae TaxID=1803846 RepID=A0A2K9PKS5_9FLAO|nr:hypothetical protein [Flavivirga eckloniae]AUP77635.1 hypothetical protein C1H87_02440 [Flavivirga eckloniae]
MKNLFLLIVSVLAVITINAQQNSIAFLDINTVDFQFEKESNTLTNSEDKRANSGYLKKVYAKETSTEVKKLEHQVLNYNIKNHSIYDDSEKATYRVVFKKKQGKITVVYNNAGDILSSKEQFKNIKIPYKLRVMISKSYPKWSFASNTCSVLYVKNKHVEKTYTIKIRKGKKTKTLKFNKAFKLIK